MIKDFIANPIWLLILCIPFPIAWFGLRSRKYYLGPAAIASIGILVFTIVISQNTKGLVGVGVGIGGVAISIGVLVYGLIFEVIHYLFGRFAATHIKLVNTILQILFYFPLGFLAIINIFGTSF